MYNFFLKNEIVIKYFYLKKIFQIHFTGKSYIISNLNMGINLTLQ